MTILVGVYFFLKGGGGAVVPLEKNGQVELSVM